MDYFIDSRRDLAGNKPIMLPVKKLQPEKSPTSAHYSTLSAAAKLKQPNSRNQTTATA
jgi:hypothetical protein